MTFQLEIADAAELSGQQYITDVVVERTLFAHTKAHITIRWQDMDTYDGRSAAFLAAKVLNHSLTLLWKDNNLAEHVPCFRGYVEEATAERQATFSCLHLACVSYSRRTDLVPRYRAFQATTLLDIVQQVAKTEPLIKVMQSADLNLPVTLSLQHGETDFAYLRRLCLAWGIPMATQDQTGQVFLGARGVETSQPFPDSDWGWTRIAFHGTAPVITHLTSSADGGGGGASNGTSGSNGTSAGSSGTGNSGAGGSSGAGSSGPTAIARTQISELNGQLSTKAAVYHTTEDRPAIHKHVGGAASLAGASGYHLSLEGAVLPFSPGEVVPFEGQTHLIREVKITGFPQQTTAVQEFWLQPLTLPLEPQRTPPRWHSRTVWAHVTANEHDPQQQGRVQVEFEWEHLDPQPSSARAWLHTLTPYGGGMKPDAQGKATEYNGFYSLPEIGERVLVEFLGEWDSEAVIAGAVRAHPVSIHHNPHDAKRWRTPAGNEISLVSRSGTEVVQMHTQDKLVFESVVSGGGQSVLLTCGEGGANIVHLQTGGGGTRLDIRTAGDLLLNATGHIQIEGKSVQVKATGGDVRLDGSPDIFLDSGARSLPAAPFAPFAEELLPVIAPKPKTWIEIVLKDNLGRPASGERYQLHLPDGTVQHGLLDAHGKARVEGVDPGSARVSFPDTDGEDWHPS